MRRILLTPRQMDQALGFDDGQRIMNAVYGGRPCAGNCGRTIVGDEPWSISIGDKHFHGRCWEKQKELDKVRQEAKAEK